MIKFIIILLVIIFLSILSSMCLMLITGLDSDIDREDNDIEQIKYCKDVYDKKNKKLLDK